MKKAVIYTRVSTRKQEDDRQVSDLKQYAAKNDIEVVKVFRQQISGSKPIQKRKAGKAFLRFIEEEDIGLVLVSEISRLGRSAIDVQRTIDYLVHEAKVNVFIHQQSMYLLNEDGEYRAMSKMFVDLLANFAQMERETLVDRINSGLAEARRKGKTLGRPKGTKMTDKELLKKHRKVVKELESGTSIRKTAKICEVGVSTVQRVKKLISS